MRAVVTLHFSNSLQIFMLLKGCPITSLLSFRQDSEEEMKSLCILNFLVFHSWAFVDTYLSLPCSKQKQ